MGHISSVSTLCSAGRQYRNGLSDLKTWWVRVWPKHPWKKIHMSPHSLPWFHLLNDEEFCPIFFDQILKVKWNNNPEGGGIYSGADPGIAKGWCGISNPHYPVVVPPVPSLLHLHQWEDHTLGNSGIFLSSLKQIKIAPSLSLPALRPLSLPWAPHSPALSSASCIVQLKEALESARLGGGWAHLGRDRGNRVARE